MTSSVFQFRRDTAANWTSNNPVLAEGETGLVIDGSGNTTAQKIGNGTDDWATLAFYEGAAGADGVDGVDGVDGTNGTDGVDGATGPAGADGVDGAVGPQGVPGAAGVDGSDGVDGDTGPSGADGSNGVDGSDGAAGIEGPIGATGAVGATGPAGAAGPIGATGPAGADGADGGTVFAAMRLTNTDTTTDINTASLTEIPLSASSAFGAGFTQTGNAIETDFAGTVEITASVWGSSTSQRPAIACEFFKNGVSLGVRYSTGYIRSNAGHNEASTACTPWIETCSDGDLFTVRGIREGNSGTVTMAVAGYTYFQAKRLA